MNDPQLISKYLDQLQKIEGRVKSTMDFQKRTLDKWSNFLSKNKNSLSKSSPQDLVNFLTERRSKVKDATAQGELCVLRKLFFFLFEFRFITHNPAKSLPAMVCNIPDEKSFLTVAECFQILKSIDISTDIGFRNHLIIALLWSNGLRPSELTNLVWSDINLIEATIIVREGKGKKQRQLFLNDRLNADLLKYQNKLPAFPNTPVFFSMKGSTTAPMPADRRALTANCLREIINRKGQQAGIDHPISPMTFRHTFATHMFEAGLEIDEIKEMLGHDLDTETCIYIHVTLDTARKLLNAHKANPFFKGYAK